MVRRLLIITADDFGYCSQRNRGVVECYLRGGITRASLLVNGESASEAAALAEKHNIPVGLHFNITEGVPASHRDEVSSLLNPKGMFWTKTEFLRRLLKQRCIVLEQVAHELRAQICEFERLIGQTPSHVDGHQHVHVLPGVCDVMAKTLKGVGAERTRIPDELDIAGCAWLGEARRRFSSEVAGYAREARAVYAQHDVSSTDGFVGMATMGSYMTDERLQHRLKMAFMGIEESVSPDRDGVVATVELMVHVGYPAVPGKGGCGEGCDEFAQSPDRLHEMGVVCSDVMKQWYTAMHITLDGAK